MSSDVEQHPAERAALASYGARGSDPLLHFLNWN